MASSPLLTLLLILCFLRPSATSSLTFSLYPINPTPALTNSDPYLLFNQLSTASRTRALGLKRPNRTAAAANSLSSASDSVVDIPLYSHSYGGYSIDLGFGTPPQSLSLVFDTGSSLVWFPCTSHYVCSRCNFPGGNEIHRFIPRLSSSARIIGCSHPKCAWLYGGDAASRCRHCASRANCTCPPYIIQYGSGSTGGILLSETVAFPGGQTKASALVGCSVASTRQPAGIAGFGRAVESLPSQLGARRFSHCLLSRKFDETPMSSELVLETGSGRSGRKSAGVSYTPLLPNPGKSIAAYQEFYYVLLRKVIVGDKHLKLPYKYLVPGSKGSGGTIVDSGTTLTFMEKPIFQIVSMEIEAQMSKYRRSIEAESRSGLRPCFNISGVKKVQFPEFRFLFKGGADMSLPLENYFAFVGGAGDICFTMVTDDDAGQESIVTGPAIILGSFQQQNFFIEYDLENERFGFRKQNCVKH